MDEPAATTESERRIRAIVRAVMSPGVWLAVALQVLVLGVLVYQFGPLIGTETAAGELPGTFLLLAVLLSVYAYLMSGTSRSFALGTPTVSAQETFRRGKEVFTAFLLLAVKVLLLGLALLYVLGLLVQFISAVTGAGTEVVLRRLAPGIKAVSLFVPFALVYWLPVVFVRRDFRVMATLRAALQIIWRQLPRSGFIAFLVFVPFIALWLLPEASPFPVLLVVSVIGQLMAWAAYVYCVESVIDNPQWGRLAASG